MCVGAPRSGAIVACSRPRYAERIRAEHKGPHAAPGHWPRLRGANTVSAAPQPYRLKPARMWRSLGEATLYGTISPLRGSVKCCPRGFPHINVGLATTSRPPGAHAPVALTCQRYVPITRFCCDTPSSVGLLQLGNSDNNIFLVVIPLQNRGCYNSVTLLTTVRQFFFVYCGMERWKVRSRLPTSQERMSLTTFTSSSLVSE